MMDQPGHNLTQLKKDIAQGIFELECLKQERSSCNEEMSAIRETLATKGIPKKALAMAISYKNMDPDKRECFDLAYDIVRESIGLPYKPQGDLFDQSDANAEADKDITDNLNDTSTDSPTDVSFLNNQDEDETPPETGPHELEEDGDTEEAPDYDAEQEEFEQAVDETVN